MMMIPFNNSISEEHFGICKEYVQHAVTDLHCWTENNGDIL